jgi:protoporphyrinogen oxidase
MVWTIPADNRQAIAAGAVPHCEAPARVDSFYPKGKEGISAIPRALLHAGKGEILTECAATAVFPDRRTVMTESGAMVKYTHLASSLPLPVLVGLIHDAPEAIKAAAANLSCQPVTVVEIGASSFGGNLSDHWVYFPEPEFPMYRLIRLEMISPDLAPEGGCSLLLECPGDRTPSREAVLSQLVDMGVLRDTKVDHYRTRTVQHAYVRFTHGYQESLLAIREYLAHIGISSVGRYGEWAYMNIEQAIQSGLAAGRSLSGVKEACGAGR